MTGEMRGTLVKLGLVGALPLFAAACTEEEDPLPIPAEFEQAFVGGTICMPTTAPISSMANPVSLPIRIDMCPYRCINLSGNRYYYYFACSGGICELYVVQMGHYFGIENMDGCDGRHIDLEAPPEGECTMQSFDISMGGPTLPGSFSVRIPYFDQVESAEVAAALDNDTAGELIPMKMRSQKYVEREFQLNVADGNTVDQPVCNDIPFPE